MQTTTEQPGSIQTTLGTHHRSLERRFDEVLTALRLGDHPQAASLWTALDRELTEHLALEERELLPKLAEREPAAVEGLRAEHAQLRRDLGELGIAVDLKRITASSAQAFFDHLRAHAAREDALLYRWADRQLRDRASFLTRFRQLVRG